MKLELLEFYAKQCAPAESTTAISGVEIADAVASELFWGGADMLRPFRNGEEIGKYDDGFNRKQIVAIVTKAVSSTAIQDGAALAIIRRIVDENSRFNGETSEKGKPSDLICTRVRMSYSDLAEARALAAGPTPEVSERTRLIREQQHSGGEEVTAVMVSTPQLNIDDVQGDKEDAS